MQGRPAELAGGGRGFLGVIDHERVEHLVASMADAESNRPGLADAAGDFRYSENSVNISRRPARSSLISGSVTPRAAKNGPR
jgi:hypothetical protein